VEEVPVSWCLYWIKDNGRLTPQKWGESPNIMANKFYWKNLIAHKVPLSDDEVTLSLTELEQRYPAPQEK